MIYVTLTLNLILINTVVGLPLLTNQGWAREEGNSKSMLDAMVQLVTGSEEGFDDQFYGELVECMAEYDERLISAQDSAWGGMISYFESNGTADDRWGGCLGNGHCYEYHEQNATAQTFKNMTIYEPCNYVSNVAYYHVVTQICRHKDNWSMPRDHVRSLLQGFATLAMGSSFWHGSHTYLGNVADNRFIDVVSFVAHQASLQHIPYSPVLHHLSKAVRNKTAVESTGDLIDMFQDKPVEEWTETILGLDMPDYYLTFSGIVSTFLTLLLDDDLADQLIPQLMDLFKLPEEQRDFVLNFYLPEIRNRTAHIDLTLHQKKELEGNILSTLIKLIYAFLWQEYALTDSPLVFNPIANVIGTSLIKYVNAYANSLNTFPIYDQDIQNGRNTYPANDRCNYEEPHAKWHLQSANGLMDLIYLADYINNITKVGNNPT